MSFDGPTENLIDAWARNELPPRKRREGSVWIQEHNHCSTLFSYAVPIASLWMSAECDDFAHRCHAVIGTRYSLERTSLTTNKHLKWADRALPRYIERATLVQGRVPETDGDWTAFLKFFRVVHAPNLSQEVKSLWRERAQQPWNEQVQRVLGDMYFDAGFGEPLPEHEFIFLNTRGFVIGNRHGEDIVVAL